jgi:hypothetical protein
MIRGVFGSKAGGVGIGLTVLLAIVLVALFLAAWVIGLSNKDKQFRNLLEAKQADNTSEFDNLRKKISQSVEVPDMAFDKLKEVFNEYADARSGDKNASAALANWIHEAVPNVDVASETFVNLQNIITSSRDAWTQRQKELLDIKRQHDNLLDTDPGGFVLRSFLGREEVDVQIVTSTLAERAFETGTDDDFSLRPSQPEAPASQ